MDQMKDDVSSAGIKVKWAQNKLKTELESHKVPADHQLRARRALLQFKELCSVENHKGAALLVLNRTSLNCNNALLALN